MIAGYICFSVLMLVTFKIFVFAVLMLLTFKIFVFAVLMLVTFKIFVFAVLVTFKIFVFAVLMLLTLRFLFSYPCITHSERERVSKKVSFLSTAKFSIRILVFFGIE
eukprot:Pompholyxophrys_punicea_v1_NODE_357_length_2166_cov_19.413548.p4 type:complete len:107 gc:universal NODE_357_length_2166_cov_19.413548:948-1268(+)